MKNEDIIPGQLVPKDIRLQVYKEAIEVLENGKNGIDKYNLSLGFGLCLILIPILYDLEDFLANAPNGQSQSWTDTTSMFPELDQYVLRELNNRINNINEGSELNTKAERFNIRIEILNRFITQLEQSE